MTWNCQEVISAFGGFLSYNWIEFDHTFISRRHLLLCPLLHHQYWKLVFGIIFVINWRAIGTSG